MPTRRGSRRSTSTFRTDVGAASGDDDLRADRREAPQEGGVEVVLPLAAAGEARAQFFGRLVDGAGRDLGRDAVESDRTDATTSRLFTLRQTKMPETFSTMRQERTLCTIAPAL